MSLLQVVGSSRISNTVYVGVGSIFWTWTILTFQVEMDLSVQTVALLVTPASAIAAFLWAAQIERGFVLHILNRILMWQTRFIRYHMGWIVIFLKPWQSTTIESFEPIEDVLRRSLRRTLERPSFLTDIDELSQLFWFSVTAYPVLNILEMLQPRFVGLTIWTPLIITVFVLFVIVRMRKRPQQAAFLTVLTWISETMNADARRRKTLAPLPQLDKRHHAEIREVYEVMIKEVLSLAEADDWEGFARNSVRFLDLLESPNRENQLIESFDVLVSDLLHQYEQDAIQGPMPSGVTIAFLRMLPSRISAAGKSHVEDALDEINRISENAEYGQFLYEFISRWSQMKGWKDLYGLFSSQTIRMLSHKNIKVLAHLPYLFDGIEKYEWRVDSMFDPNNPQFWPLHLIQSMLNAEQANHLDARSVFHTIAEWDVSPVHYHAQCGVRVLPLFLEESHKFKITDISKILKNILKRTQNIDPDKAASNLLNFKSDSGFASIRDQLDAYASGNREYAEISAQILSRMEKPI
jgi:hypothetical protein